MDSPAHGSGAVREEIAYYDGEYQRAQSLKKQGHISHSKYEETRRDRLMARHQLEAVRQDIDGVVAKLDDLDEYDDLDVLDDRRFVETESQHPARRRFEPLDLAILVEEEAQERYEEFEEQWQAFLRFELGSARVHDRHLGVGTGIVPVHAGSVDPVVADEAPLGVEPALGHDLAFAATGPEY